MNISLTHTRNFVRFKTTPHRSVYGDRNPPLYVYLNPKSSIKILNMQLFTGSHKKIRCAKRGFRAI